MSIRKLNNILAGWTNFVFKTEAIEKLAKERAKICAECEHNKLSICTLCGCPLAGKLRSPKTTCKDRRW